MEKEKMVFKIDVGNMSAKEAQEIVNKLKSKFQLRMGSGPTFEEIEEEIKRWNIYIKNIEGIK